MKKDERYRKLKRRRKRKKYSSLDRVVSKCFFRSWCGGGIDFYFYQLAFGVSLRWWNCGPVFRIYLGPLKFWFYITFLEGR